MTIYARRRTKPRYSITEMWAMHNGGLERAGQSERAGLVVYSLNRFKHLAVEVRDPYASEQVR